MSIIKKYTKIPDVNINESIVNQTPHYKLDCLNKVYKNTSLDINIFKNNLNKTKIINIFNIDEFSSLYDKNIFLKFENNINISKIEYIFNKMVQSLKLKNKTILDENEYLSQNIKELDLKIWLKNKELNSLKIENKKLFTISLKKFPDYFTIMNNLQQKILKYENDNNILNENLICFKLNNIFLKKNQVVLNDKIKQKLSYIDTVLKENLNLKLKLGNLPTNKKYNNFQKINKLKYQKTEKTGTKISSKILNYGNKISQKSKSTITSKSSKNLNLVGSYYQIENGKVSKIIN